MTTAKSTATLSSSPEALSNWTEMIRSLRILSKIPEWKRSMVDASRRLHVLRIETDVRGLLA